MSRQATRETRVLEFLKAEIQKKGYPPTVREIGAALGIRSTSTVHKALLSLEKQGFIRKDPSKRRAIEVLPGPEALAQRSYRGSGHLDSSVEETSVAHVPLVGHIAAGSPILAEENIEEFMPIPAQFLGPDTNFMLTVKGDSMIEAGIFDGDYLLVHVQNSAENGDIVVAMIDGFESEATVKTFYKEKDHVRLQPENHRMSPIIVQDVTILGRVKGVFRYMA